MGARFVRKFAPPNPRERAPSQKSPPRRPRARFFRKIALVNPREPARSQKSPLRETGRRFFRKIALVNPREPARSQKLPLQGPDARFFRKIALVNPRERALSQKSPLRETGRRLLRRVATQGPRDPISPKIVSPEDWHARPSEKSRPVERRERDENHGRSEGVRAHGMRASGWYARAPRVAEVEDGAGLAPRRPQTVTWRRWS
jgi:hypothetical protein